MQSHNEKMEEYLGKDYTRKAHISNRCPGWHAQENSVQRHIWKLEWIVSKSTTVPSLSCDTNVAQHRKKKKSHVITHVRFHI